MNSISNAQPMKKKPNPKRIWDELRKEFRTTINVPTEEAQHGYARPRRKWDTPEQRQARSVYYILNDKPTMANQ